MGRNGPLRCCCPCFSSGHASSSPGKGYANSGFSSDSEVHPELTLPPSGTPASSSSVKGFADAGSSQLHPSCKLLPLPPDPAFPHHAVGIDDQVDRVIRLLEWEDEANVAVAVVLHGFGGTGKTTLADAVVATLDFQGWKCFTVVPFQSTGNVEEGQVEIQGVPENEPAFIYIGNAMVRGEDLEKLLPKSCKRLRLLLTARDETVGDVISGYGIRTQVYPLRPLHSQDAMKLLSSKMGVKAEIPQHHMPQINEILKICDGVPVVLERVGAYICQCPDKDEAYRRVIEWSKGGKPFSSTEEYSIEKKGLLFDLDELPASAREPFLDICSFFNAWDWDKVSSVVGEGVLNTLRNRALLLKKEESENKVMLRPIVFTIGRNMTKGKRFTSADDLTKVLEGNNLDDIRGIKGIWLQDNTSQSFLLSARTLDLMSNSLKVFALGVMTIIVGGQYCTQQFKHIIYFQAGSIPYIPLHLTALQELRYLDWVPYNNNDLQLAKSSTKLEVLFLDGGRNGRVVDIASVFSRLQGLRILKLVKFETLKILPEELSLLTQLEELDVSGCRNLEKLPQGLGNLKSLTKLSLQSCWSLQELPDSFGKLRSLKYLNLLESSIKRLPEDFGSLSFLEELCLGSAYLKELPSSLENLSSLKVLNLRYCRRLSYLPDNIGNLTTLVRIELEGSGLRSIPHSLQRLSSLPALVSLERCDKLKDLPEEFCCYLKLVKDLSFQSCESLSGLPKRLVKLASLTRLDLSFCKRLERLPEGFGQLKSLAEVNLEGCDSLQQLSADFHCLASLQKLKIGECTELEGKWMDTLAKIKTLNLVDIVGSKMLVERWAEMEKEGESWQFSVRTNYEMGWKYGENMFNKAALKLFTGKCLLKNSREEPFSLSTVAPNTILLVMYEHDEDSLTGPLRRLLEEIVRAHETQLMPFHLIYVGNYFGQLSKEFANGILAYAPKESEAFLLFYDLLEVTENYLSHSSSHVVVTEVVADGGGRKHFSTWENITESGVKFLLSKSTVYSDLQKLTETPQESNVKLLRALFDTAESRATSIFIKNCTEYVGVEKLRGKTVLLLISHIDEHPFEALIEIYSQLQSRDNLEILSIPIPDEVLQRFPPRWVNQADSELAVFESILRKVSWPVLRDPWLLKTEVCYFFQTEWGKLNAGILVVVDPNGRICCKNALPLIERWGGEVFPFTQEKMKQLEEERPEEHLSEYIINGLREMEQLILLP